MSVDLQRTPYTLAWDHMGRQGLQTDRLARVIRQRLPAFLEDCQVRAEGSHEGHHGFWAGQELPAIHDPGKCSECRKRIEAQR